MARAFLGEQGRGDRWRLLGDRRPSARRDPAPQAGPLQGEGPAAWLRVSLLLLCTSQAASGSHSKVPPGGQRAQGPRAWALSLRTDSPGPWLHPPTSVSGQVNGPLLPSLSTRLPTKNKSPSTSHWGSNYGSPRCPPCAVRYWTIFFTTCLSFSFPTCKTGIIISLSLDRCKS